MKFVFFACETRKNAAIRYRVESFSRLLEEEGHRCIVCVPAPVRWKEALYESQGRLKKLLYLFLVFLHRFAQLRHVPGAAAVFFRGPVFPYGPPFFERIISFLNPRLVMDLDDAIWEPPAFVESPFLRFMDFGWTAKMARLCKHCVAGNELIKEYVECEGCPATIIPTCIDMPLYGGKQYGNHEGQPIILGWTGLSDNLGYLDRIAPAIKELSTKYPLEMMISTSKEWDFPGITVRNRKWIIDDEINYLTEADIGLMPLIDTPRARGKCAFKALQYMGAGTPVVLSPVGMNKTVVEDGVTGFLADSPEEWYEKLEQLIRQPELRETMGRAAREHIKARYSVAHFYPTFKEVMLGTRWKKD
ncbi:MAG: glycosyltransferase [Candidatus Hydrogenedentales bacterium]|jgi:glycosyltransferase involved in cell wall biosynthesis